MPTPKIYPDTSNEVIYLFEVGSTCMIDWGDGSEVLDITTAEISNQERALPEGGVALTDYYVAAHVYAEPGYYDIKIVGHVEGITCGYQLDNPNTNHGLYNLTEFKQWGSLGSVKNIPRLFPVSAVYSASDTPSFAYEADIRGLFATDTGFGSFASANLRPPANIGDWTMNNVSHIDDLFSAQEEFNVSLNGWNTQAFQSMDSTFERCVAYNQPMDLWNVENVNSAEFFLAEALSYDQDLSGWASTNIQTCMNFAFDAPIDETEKMPPLSCVTYMPQ